MGLSKPSAGASRADANSLMRSAATLTQRHQSTIRSLNSGYFEFLVATHLSGYA